MPATTELEARVHTHLPLVDHLVREAFVRLPRHAHPDELRSAALFALTSAAASYDETRDGGFGAYATPRLRSAIADELRPADDVVAAVTTSASEHPEDVVLDRERLGYLRDAVAELPDRLQVVVRGYFFQQRRLLDIAAELGVTESRVSQLRSEALTLLRSGMQAADADVVVVTATHRQKDAERAAYCAAVAARSTVGARLDAISLADEPTPAVVEYA